MIDPKASGLFTSYSGQVISGCRDSNPCATFTPLTDTGSVRGMYLSGSASTSRGSMEGGSDSDVFLDPLLLDFLGVDLFTTRGVNSMRSKTRGLSIAASRAVMINRRVRLVRVVVPSSLMPCTGQDCRLKPIAPISNTPSPTMSISIE